MGELACFFATKYSISFNHLRPRRCADRQKRRCLVILFNIRIISARDVCWRVESTREDGCPIEEEYLMRAIDFAAVVPHPRVHVVQG